MKQFILLISMLGFVATSCKQTSGEEAKVSDATEVVEAQGKIIAVSNQESSISWEGSKPTGTHAGTIDIAQGHVTVQDNKIVGGSFVMDMNTITVTDLDGDMKAGLEGHLKGLAEGKEDHFFNVAKYPSAKFEVSKIVTLTGDEEANSTIYGNLTIRDVTKEIGFRANISVNGDRVTVKTPQFTIDRTQWGVNYGSKSIFDDLGDKFVNDDIGLKIKLVAGQAAI